MDNTLPPFNGHTRPMADDSYWVNGDREHDLFCIVAPYDQSPTLEFRHHLPSDHTWTRTEFEFYCIGFWDALQVAYPNAAIEVNAHGWLSDDLCGPFMVLYGPGSHGGSILEYV